MDIFPSGTSRDGELEPDDKADDFPPTVLAKAGAFERGQEFLGQCPELLAAEVAGALSTLRGLDTFVEAWARDRASSLDSADIARLARTVIASARARGEVAANLLKALPNPAKKAVRGPRQEA